MTRSLDGKLVLVVEDEAIIGMMICSEIEHVGGVAIGPVSSVAAAIKEIATSRLDAAILDAKLVDGDAAKLAITLAARCIPFVVTSGYEQRTLPKDLRSAPFIAKPISVSLLVEAIGRLVAGGQRQSAP